MTNFLCCICTSAIPYICVYNMVACSAVGSIRPFFSPSFNGGNGGGKIVYNPWIIDLGGVCFFT